MKKVLSLIIITAIVFSLAACGGSDETADNSDGGGEYVIGYNTWGSGIAVFEQVKIEIDYTIETLGGVASSTSDDFTADNELNNIKNFISADVDGIMMQAAVTSILPEAVRACESAKIPLVLSIFPSSAEDRAAITSEYYVGASYADLVTDGYNAGKEAAEAGFKTAVAIGGNLGDPNNDDRMDGFTTAFTEEGGNEILDVARCSSPSEALEKANALLSANRDVDVIYCITADYAPGTITALESLGLDIPIYTCSLSSEVLDYVRSGQIVRTSFGNDMGQGFAAALLYNYLDGHQILDDEGNVPDIAMIPFRVDADNLDDIIDLFFTDGVHPFSQKMLEELTWRNNPDVTYQDYIDMIENIENDTVNYLQSMQ